jgi:hypothetical protein
VTDIDRLPCSALVTKRGIKNSADFMDFFSALLGDVINGDVDNASASVACMIGDRMLALAKLQLHAGTSSPDVDPIVAARRALKA